MEIRVEPGDTLFRFIDYQAPGALGRQMACVFADGRVEIDWPLVKELAEGPVMPQSDAEAQSAGVFDMRAQGRAFARLLAAAHSDGWRQGVSDAAPEIPPDPPKEI